MSNNKIIVGSIKDLKNKAVNQSRCDMRQYISPDIISALKKLMMKYPRTRKLLTSYSIFGAAGPSNKQIFCRKQRPMKKISKK